MKITLLHLSILLFFASCNNQAQVESTLEEEKAIDSTQIEMHFDFDVDTVGFESPEEIAIGVINYLRNADTTEYLKLAIPLRVQQYLFEQNLEYRPDIKDFEFHSYYLEQKYPFRMTNFLVRAKYISEIMVRDKEFNIKEATIDTMYYEMVRIKDYGGLGIPLVGYWADFTVKMEYQGEPFYFEMPQIIRIKDKWFLYYPEYYLRDQSELDFVKKRMQEIYLKAEDFWK